MEKFLEVKDIGKKYQNKDGEVRCFKKCQFYSK